jgi:ectoine hydroxylase-related dioxygenase (phytanoyl-CoA dioxygenase family)
MSHATAPAPAEATVQQRVIAVLRQKVERLQSEVDLLRRRALGSTAAAAALSEQQLSEQQLSEQQLADYRQSGFLVLRGLLAPERAAALTRRVAAYTHGDPSADRSSVSIGFEPGREPASAADDSWAPEAVRKISGLVRSDPLFNALALDPKLVAAMQQILGNDLKLLRDTVLCKPPGGMAKEAHQDSPYWPVLPMELCSVWVALEEATVRAEHSRRTED